VNRSALPSRLDSREPGPCMPMDSAGGVGTVSDAAPLNAMSVDVEDYFQVSAMEAMVDRSDWESYPSRVARNVEAILDLFERHHVHATFFILGWVADRHPALLRRIAAAGHEVASHGMAHYRISSQSPEQFREDVRRAKAVIEDAAGAAVRGYRAASFSLDATTPWAHAILHEEGYSYSSSIYPIRHDHYGMPEAPRGAFAPLDGASFWEIPISTVEIAGRRIPCGGGGYFRLLPYRISERALRRVNTVDGMPGVFYFHPWEIDPEQPRVPGLSRRTRFRHYTNLARMQARLERVLAAFSWSRLDRVFLESLSQKALASRPPGRVKTDPELEAS